MNEHDGIYAAYLTASASQGVAFLVFKDAKIIGVDLGGVKFDGDLKPSASGGYDVSIYVQTPPNLPTIQGMITGPSGINYKLQFEMPREFLAAHFIPVITPMGKVNFRLEKLRGLGAL